MGGPGESKKEEDTGREEVKGRSRPRREHAGRKRREREAAKGRPVETAP